MIRYTFIIFYSIFFFYPILNKFWILFPIVFYFIFRGGSISRKNFILTSLSSYILVIVGLVLIRCIFLIQSHDILYYILYLNLVISLFFSSSRFFNFFFFYEISLIPILLLILGFGYQIERIEASIWKHNSYYCI